jgi:predicted RNA binding protein YcfA (HicA-like mRNA interferase family)
MNRRRLLRRLASGAVHNVRFTDIIDLVEGFGFKLDRIRGSHHLFVHPDVPEVLNLQPEGSQAKAYQIRQLLRLVEEYELRLED